MTSDETSDHLVQAETSDLLRQWAGIMAQLRRRGVIRSDNNPVADYAEWLVAERLGLTLVGNSTSGHDAVGEDGARYQIKARRLVTPKTSRQLSILRNLDGDPFDWLVVVMFERSFDVREMWKLPVALVREHAMYREYVNGYVFHARASVLADGRAIRLI